MTYLNVFSLKKKSSCLIECNSTSCLIKYTRWYEYANETRLLSFTQLRDPLVDDLIGHGCVWRQKHQRFQAVFLRLSLVHCSFKQKICLMNLHMVCL